MNVFFKQNVFRKARIKLISSSQRNIVLVQEAPDAFSRRWVTVKQELRVSLNKLKVRKMKLKVP